MLGRAERSGLLTLPSLNTDSYTKPCIATHLQEGSSHHADTAAATAAGDDILCPLAAPCHQHGSSLAQAEGSDGADIARATEACIAALYVLATPGLPKQAYPEDTVEHALDVLKFNLMSNVMAFHDARLCQIHRPHLLAAAAGEVAGCPLRRSYILLKTSYYAQQVCSSDRKSHCNPCRPCPGVICL